jgi:hypothetical protein
MGEADPGPLLPVAAPVTTGLYAQAGRAPSEVDMGDLVHDYHDGNRYFQDRFDTRRLADRSAAVRPESLPSGTRPSAPCSAIVEAVRAEVSKKLPPVLPTQTTAARWPESAPLGRA